MASPSASDAGVASLREDEAKRDASQIVELTAMARSTSEQVKPVVAGLRSGLPVADTGAAATESITDKQLAEWKQIMAQQVERHKDTPSGNTATNIARNGLRNAVSQLSLAVDTFAAARALPADHQAPLLVVASRQRLLAVNDWSVAATPARPTQHRRRQRAPARLPHRLTRRRRDRRRRLTRGHLTPTWLRFGVATITVTWRTGTLTGEQLDQALDVLRMTRP